MELIDRYRGSLLGLAVGDAVGSACEFSPPGSFSAISDMIGGGPFNLKPGEWTDDTSMALCLAESLVEVKGFDAADQLRRYCKWFRSGYMSSNGRMFDIGQTCRIALTRFEKTGRDQDGNTDPQSAGNGSLMRLAPVPLYFARNLPSAIEHAAASSRSTHGATAAVDACRFYARLIVGALEGASKEDLLSPNYFAQANAGSLCPEIDNIAKGSYKGKQPPYIEGTGYVVKSLEAALWAFESSANFKDGCLKAVNLGNDSDTTAAIYGQLAGCYYGESSIPQSWLEKLAKRELIEILATRLHLAAQNMPS